MPSPLVFAPDSAEHPALSEKGLIPLSDTGYWVCRQQLHFETLLIQAVDFFQNHPSPLNFPKEWLEATRLEILANKKSKIDENELSEQLQAVFETFDHAACLSVITGPPGAAKSTVASLWAQIARAQYPDLPFIIITQEKPALDRLCDKINLNDALALTLENALTVPWPSGAVLIIDEAGLLGTESLAGLLAHAKEINAAKIILIGDDKHWSRTPRASLSAGCASRKKPIALSFPNPSARKILNCALPSRLCTKAISLKHSNIFRIIFLRLQ